MELASKHSNFTEKERSFLKPAGPTGYSEDFLTALQRQEPLSERNSSNAILEPFVLLSEGIYRNKVVEKIRKRALENAELTENSIRYYQTSLSSDPQKVKRLFLPYWIVSYKYNESTYRLLIDGWNLNGVYGDTPEDTYLKSKISKVSREQRRVFNSRFAVAVIIAASVLAILYLLVNLSETFKSVVILVSSLIAISIWLSVTSDIDYFTKRKFLDESISIRRKSAGEYTQKGNLFLTDYPE